MSDTLRNRLEEAVLDAEVAWQRGDVEGTLAAAITDAFMAVIRNPTDEDVERAARAEYENAGTGDWDTAGEQVQGEWLSDTDAAIHAYMGGGEA